MLARTLQPALCQSNNGQQGTNGFPKSAFMFVTPNKDKTINQRKYGPAGPLLNNNRFNGINKYVPGDTKWLNSAVEASIVSG